MYVYLGNVFFKKDNRINATDHRVAAAYELIDRLDSSVLALGKRVTPLEGIKLVQILFFTKNSVRYTNQAIIC